MPISLYPPTLQSTQAAFLYDTNSYMVYFALQQITSLKDIGHVQIRVVRQSNNKSIVNTSLYPDGIIYKDTPAAPITGTTYGVAILSSDLSETWQPGYLYKIQVRFGTNAKYTSVEKFAAWKKEQIDNSAFSEWSTVMVIKAISKPTVYIKNAEKAKQDVISKKRTESSLTPTFTGSCTIEEQNNEAEDKYRFILYDEEMEVLQDTGWLQHNSSVETTDTYRFQYALINNATYTVEYYIQTINGYEASANSYTFMATQSYLFTLDGVSFFAVDSLPYNAENGCINLYLTADETFSGNLVISRASEYTDFTIWEDLKYLLFNKQDFNNTLIFQDFIIESGVKYKYAIQQENSEGLRTSPLYETEKLARSVDFEYSFLYHDDVQLRMQFDQQLSSFKHTTLTTKQDTLGGKYPSLVRNGQAYYAEFPISGTISLHMDSDQTFFSLNSNGYWYDGENVISSDKYDEDQELNTNITPDNVYMERRFREKVEEFLNNFDYKLYKSPTEGNIIVVLHNVSLTPKTELGRMIFSFSATAYEVLENTLENLNEFGIIDIGGFEYLSNDEKVRSFGQISGLYAAGENLYDIIKKQEEVSIGGGYKYNLLKITSINVQTYPEIDLTAKKLELMAQKNEAIDNGEDYSEYDQQYQAYKDLEKALEGPLVGTVKLEVNGKTITIPPGKIYSLKYDIDSLKLISSIQPLVISYTCQLNQIIDTSVLVVSAIDTSRIWGQISGIFTGTDEVLKSYNYNYANSETYRIYSNSTRTTSIKYDSQGDILVDNTNFNLYKTVNIYDIIKEETQKQVEFIYDTRFEEVDGELFDGTRYYEFSHVTYFDIEADEGTILNIGRNENNITTIRIGPTGRYTLSDLDGNVKYIALAAPSFCVINYKCLTTQKTMKQQGV